MQSLNNIFLNSLKLYCHLGKLFLTSYDLNSWPCFVQFSGSPLLPSSLTTQLLAWNSITLYNALKGSGLILFFIFNMFRITKLIIKVDHCYKLYCLKWASGLEFCKVKVSSGLNAILAIVNSLVTNLFRTGTHSNT